MKVTISKGTGIDLGFWKDMRTENFIRAYAEIETADIPKVETACMFIRRGVSTARGGWSGFAYRILCHKNVMALPEIMLMADRGQYYSPGKYLTIQLPEDNKDVMANLRDKLIPIFLLSGWERKDDRYRWTGWDRFESRRMTIARLPESITYKTLAPVIREHLYEPLGLTKKVLESKCNDVLTKGESK